MTLEAKSRAYSRQHNLLAWHAWHVAALPRMKQFPKLSSLMLKNRNRKRQTPEQMLAIAKQWTLALGGAIETKAENIDGR